MTLKVTLYYWHGGPDDDLVGGGIVCSVKDQATGEAIFIPVDAKIKLPGDVRELQKLELPDLTTISLRDFQRMVEEDPATTDYFVKNGTMLVYRVMEKLYKLSEQPGVIFPPFNPRSSTDVINYIKQALEKKGVKKSVAEPIELLDVAYNGLKSQTLYTDDAQVQIDHGKLDQTYRDFKDSLDYPLRYSPIAAFAALVHELSEIEDKLRAYQQMSEFFLFLALVFYRVVQFFLEDPKLEQLHNLQTFKADVAQVCSDTQKKISARSDSGLEQDGIELKDMV